MNIEKLIAELDVFAREREWDQFHSVKNLSMALAVEASELMEIFQWMSGDESNSITDPRKQEKIRDEVADVFIYLLRLATKSGIDLEEAVKEKMIKNSIKYPVELSKGNAKKYDEL